MQYDIIGDIHGEFATLEKLLLKLDYQCVSGVWQNPSKKVIFLGDFIDRGPQQKAVLDLVIPMVEQGHALAVMGNHEFNALAFHTATDDGRWLRPRTDKNILQHWAFLAEFLPEKDDLRRALDFFWTLPLWLEQDGLRVVHACWSDEIIDRLRGQYGGSTLTAELLHQASIKGTAEYQHLETLLKGRELPLPPGIKFLDKDKNPRSEIRVKWWDRSVKTYQEAYLGPEDARSSIPDIDTEGRHLIHYPDTAAPVFLGHYWMTGVPTPLAPNIACLDYSVAKPGGKLVAYSWNSEKVLCDSNFVSVDRVAQKM